MAKKKNYDNEDGVWRTVGGRRVFIRTGQSLSSAMKESGKFNSIKKGTEGTMIINNDEKKNLQDKSDFVAYGVEKWMAAKQDYRHSANMQEKYRKLVKNNPDNKELKDYYEKLKNETKESKANFDKEVEDYKNSTYGKINILRKEDYSKDIYSKNVANNDEYELYKRAKVNPDSIDPMTENSTDWEALDKKYGERFKNDKAKVDLKNAEVMLKGSQRSLEFERDGLARAKRDGQSVENISDRTRRVHELELEVQKDENYYNKLKKEAGVRTLDGSYEKDNKGKVVTQKEYDDFRQAYRDGKISKEDYRNDNYGALKKERDAYESKVFGSDVTKADEQMKKTFGKDFKYDEEKKYSDPRKAVDYYLKKGEFEKADKYIRDYGLEDEKDEFLEGQNYKIQKDYKEYTKRINANKSVGQKTSDLIKESKTKTFADEIKDKDNMNNKFLDLKKNYNPYKDNAEVAKKETIDYISSLKEGTKLGLVVKDTASGWTSHGGYHDEWARVKEYEKLGKNKWQTPNGIKTDKDMMLTALHNEYSLTDIETAKATAKKLSAGDKTTFREITNVGVDSAGNKVGVSRSKTYYTNSAKPDYDHFAGWELYSDDPNRYGDIVRNHNERNALKDRYQGTYNYLQSTTNMSGAEILELLKKIDEDRK